MRFLILDRSLGEKDLLPKVRNWCVNNSVELIEATYIPFEKRIVRFKDNSIIRIHPWDHDVFVMGSIAFNFAAENNYRNHYKYNGQWYGDKFNCDSYYDSALKPFITQQEFMFNSLKCFIKYAHKGPVSKYFADQNGDVFVRPVSGYKPFDGCIVNVNKTADWAKSIPATTSKKRTGVVVAKKLDIQSEWRCVVSNGKFITGCQYKKDGWVDISPEIEDGAKEFATKIAEIYSPYPVYVVDVAKVDNKYSVMEVGSVNMCGVYDMDIDKILTTCFEVMCD